MMTVRRAVVLVGALLAAVACNGSDVQRRALERYSAGSPGGLQDQAPGDPLTDAGPVPTEQSVTPDPGTAVSGVPPAGASPSGATAGGGQTAGTRPTTGASRPSAAGTGPGQPGAVTGAARTAAGSSTARGAAPAPAPTPAAPGAGEQGGATDVGVTANSIKIGHIGIYSGPVGTFGQSLSWAGRATMQAMNDAGGINGRKLDVLVRDDGWDGTKGLNAARDLVERQKVFALCCIQSVSTSDPVTPYADQMKVPHVGGDGWGDIQYKGAWSFPLGVPSASEARVLAKYQVEKLGVKTAAVMYLNNTTGQSFRDAYRQTLEKLGAKVVVDQPATFDDPGTTTLIARSRTANVDTVAVYADPGIFGRMIREAAGQNYRPPKGFSGSTMFYFNVTPDLAGPWAEGSISMNHWTPHDQDTPGLRRYRDVVTKYYPKIDHTAWTQTGYMGASLLGDALKRLGLNVTRQRLKDTLDQTTDFDLGLGSKVAFRPGRHHANTSLQLTRLEKDGDGLKWKSIGYGERDATYDNDEG
jgi:branched-chain amino acid transport system substrate-binding protein